MTGPKRVKPEIKGKGVGRFHLENYPRGGATGGIRILSMMVKDVTKFTNAICGGGGGGGYA